MDDAGIIELYFQRSEDAIAETDRKYGPYCTKIAMNILSSLPDSEECVSDTWLKAWNAMPPQKPDILSAFLGRICRNCAISRYRERGAKKRAGDEFSLSLDELDECIPSKTDPARAVDEKELGEIISRFLKKQSKDARVIFVRRYFYGDELGNIARRLSFSESKVKSSLFRTRRALREFLESEGVSI